MNQVNVSDIPMLMANLWLRHRAGLPRLKNNIFEVMLPPLPEGAGRCPQRVITEGTKEFEDALWAAVDNLIDNTMYD